MNYTAWIENRKSVRAFTDRRVSEGDLARVKAYYHEECKRLVPELKTALLVFGDDAREKLEGAAGYNQFLIGAPNYLVLLSETGEQFRENGGYMMQDLVLQLTRMGLDSCWLTFTDSEAVKSALGIDSRLDVVAMVAFGYGQKTRKRPRINILSMSNVDITAQRRYMEPKRGVKDMVYLDSWGNHHGLDDYIGFFDDMLWEAFYAASLAPSYLNRQAYGFVIRDSKVYLIRRPDEYTTEADGALSLGIVLLHFNAVAEHWAGRVNWYFENPAVELKLPQGHEIVAWTAL